MINHTATGFTVQKKNIAAEIYIFEQSLIIDKFTEEYNQLVSTIIIDAFNIVASIHR